MATSEIEISKVQGGYLDNVTFNDLGENYKNGLYSLRSNSNDTKKPSSATYFWVLQISDILSGTLYVLQFAVPTDTSSTIYMRKRRGDANGWTDWKALSFA